MGDRWLGPDDVVAFVDAAEQHVAEVNRPDTVGDFLSHGNSGRCIDPMNRVTTSLRCT